MIDDTDEVLLALDRWQCAEQAFVAVITLANERGMSWRRLEEVTGIPFQTLYRWAHGGTEAT